MFKYISDETTLINVFETYTKQQANDVWLNINNALLRSGSSEVEITPATPVTINMTKEAMDKLKNNLFNFFLDQNKLIAALDNLSVAEFKTVKSIWTSASRILRLIETQETSEKLKSIQQKLADALKKESAPSIDDFKRSAIKAKLAAFETDKNQDIPDNVTYLAKVG